MKREPLKKKGEKNNYGSWMLFESFYHVERKLGKVKGSTPVNQMIIKLMTEG